MRRALGRLMSSSSAAESFVEVTARGSCLSITLARPKALNSLTLPMVRDLHKAFQSAADEPSIGCILLEGAGGKAFCAGGDVKGIAIAGKEPPPAGDEPPITDAFFREEYALNAAIGGSPKPQVSVWDGIVMGGGVGLSVHGKYRVCTEKAMFAMPETNIGLFPDVGGSHFLASLPGELGTYIGLSGARLHAADLLHAGLATHFVPSSALPELSPALSSCTSAADVDGVLTKLSQPVDALPADAKPPTLAPNREAIDAALGYDSIEEILSALERMSASSTAGDDGKAAFAAATLSTLSKMSPTSLKLTLRLLREAREGQGVNAPLTRCLEREFRVVQRCVTPGKQLGSDDFFEGIRAALIDKDRKPVWSPSEPQGVGAADVDAYFEGLGDKELKIVPGNGFVEP